MKWAVRRTRQDEAVSLISGEHFLDPNGKGEPKDITTDFGIAPMGVKPGDLKTVHSIAIKRDEKEDAKRFFRCEPVFKNVPAAMWEKPDFKDTNEEFLKKPDVNPDRHLVSGVLGGLEVLPAVLPHPSETLPVERGELQYECDRFANAYRWETIPIFKAEEKDTTWARDKVNDTILKQKPADDANADAKQPWKVREDILQELGLEREEIYFGQPADQYLIDAPQIETCEAPTNV